LRTGLRDAWIRRRRQWMTTRGSNYFYATIRTTTIFPRAGDS
jgi:hypothetical protein